MDVDESPRSSFLLHSTVGLIDYFKVQCSLRPLCSSCNDAGWLTETGDDLGGHFKCCPFCTTPVRLGPGGRWQIVRALGRGAHASTWMANDRYGGTAALRAIKIWRCGMESVALNEAAWLEALGRLARHPWQIVRLFGHLQIGPHAGLVLELLEPVDPLSDGGNFPINQAGLARFVHNLASQLYLLHKGLGAIHADLKIDNVMWDGQREQYKLIDYGNCMSQGFCPGGIFQSQDYRAPEVIAGLGSYDEAIDAWSLGILIVEVVRWWRIRQECRQHGISLLSANQSFHLWSGCSFSQQSPKLSSENPLCERASEMTLSASAATESSAIPSTHSSSSMALLIAMTDLLGPLPDHPFGKLEGHPLPFTSQYAEHIQIGDLRRADSFWRHWRRSNLAALTGIREGHLLDLLVGLLDFDPAKRMPMSQVLEHPFVSAAGFGWINLWDELKLENVRVVEEKLDSNKENIVNMSNGTKKSFDFDGQYYTIGIETDSLPNLSRKSSILSSMMTTTPPPPPLPARKRSLAPKPPQTTTTKFVFISNNPAAPPSTTETAKPPSLVKRPSRQRKASNAAEVVTIKISNNAKTAAEPKSITTERRGPASLIRRRPPTK